MPVRKNKHSEGTLLEGITTMVQAIIHPQFRWFQGRNRHCGEDTPSKKENNESVMAVSYSGGRAPSSGFSDWPAQ
jgi:hypothetical protein